MADEVIRFTVTLKGGIFNNHPQRRQDTVAEKLEAEGIEKSVQKHPNGNWVNYTSVDQELHASILVEGHINDLMLPKYERAIVRGAGGRSKGWSVSATSA